MWESLKHLFSGDEDPRVSSGTPPERLASVALMVEAARLDGRFDDGERRTIECLVRRSFKLDAAQADRLVEEALELIHSRHDLQGFTHQIKTACDEDERLKLVEMLWEVVLADGEIHAFESNLVRRICGLLYVSDRASGEARLRVLERYQAKG